MEVMLQINDSNGTKELPTGIVVQIGRADKPSGEYSAAMQAEPVTVGLERHGRSVPLPGNANRSRGNANADVPKPQQQKNLGPACGDSVVCGTMPPTLADFQGCCGQDWWGKNV